MALLSLSEYKVFANITNSNADSRLTAILNSVCEYFLGKMRAIEEVTYTSELYDGDDTNTLLLKNFPITGFTSLYINGTLIASGDYVYYASSGIINYKYGIFDKGWQNISITYKAGYASVPTDIKMAVAEVVQKKYVQFDKKTESFSSETFTGGSLMVQDKEMTDFARDVIWKYRKKGLRKSY